MARARQMPRCLGSRPQRHGEALPAALATAAAAAAVSVALASSLGGRSGAAFVSAPPGALRQSEDGPRGPRGQAPSAADARAGGAAEAGPVEPISAWRGSVGGALLAAAAGAGTAAAVRQRAREEASSGAHPARGGRSGSPLGRRALPNEVDWAGSNTGWNDIEKKSFTDVNWLNEHGVLTICALTLFLYQAVRIASHSPPSEQEVWATTAIYLPWMFLCWRDTDQLESHYRVTFYASTGWGFMSLASLISCVYQDKAPDFAFGVLVAGNIVFLASCAYFYIYHWSRMFRHVMQNRFRPLWMPGLFGLMCLHGLTIADFAKRVDDAGWWKIVCTIYPDEWWWVADVRIIELFVTAAALWLIILHIQGVFTGMKNAALVVIGTIFLPVGIMALESTWLRASAWQHYLMVGPKYW